MFGTDSGQWRLGGSQNASLRDAGFLEQLGEAADGLARRGQVLVADQNQSQGGEGRVVHEPAELDFLLVEPLVVVGSHETEAVVLRAVALNQDLARQLPPSGASGDLAQELKGSFGGPKIGKRQGMVCRNHPHQGDEGKVVALGDHLRTGKDIGLALPEPAQDLPMRVLPAGRVPIEPIHTGLGEGLL